MNDLRERLSNFAVNNIVTIKRSANQIADGYDFADTILALLPKPTVRVKCQKCGGSGGRVACGKENCEGCMAPQDCEQAGIYKHCPSCADGWNEYEIMWDLICPSCKGKNTGVLSCCKDNGHLIRALTLTDLIDPDVAYAYGHFVDCYGPVCKQLHILHNKGTLRIEEAK